MPTVASYCGALSLCLNAILLIFVLRQASRDRNDAPGLPTVARATSQSAIRSTNEALYVMYGEGDFADDDDRLLDYIRSMTSRQGPGGRHLSRASRVDFSQVGGSRFVDGLLARRRNGFFVECGAFRGEELSDTLFFEMERNWTGILIEAHPNYHRAILSKNRRALVLRACLSANRRPGLVKFKLAGWGSGVSVLNKNALSSARGAPETDVQCFSLNSIMAAIGVHHVDFMVLDVEGAELPVLQTINWTRLSVDVFSIEYSGTRQVEKLEKLRRFFNETGSYKEVGKLPRGFNESIAQDVIFMRV